MRPTSLQPERPERPTELRRVRAALLAVLAVGVLGCGEEPADDTLAENRPGPAGVARPLAEAPPGFRLVERGGSSGRSFARSEPRAQSASLLIRDALGRLTDYFGTRPTTLVAFAEQRDREAQAVFGVVAAGAPMRGFLLASVGPEGGTVGAVVADEREPGGVFDQLLANLGPRLAGPAAAARPRPAGPGIRTPLPDGSGAITLPAGWRIASAYQGAVDCLGPQGGRIMLGYALPVTTPEGTVGWAREALIAPFVDPLTALEILTPQVAEFNRQVNPGAPMVRFMGILESAPVASAMNGRAALVLWDFALDGRPFRALNLVDTAMTGPTTWLFYSSSVSAPAELFEAMLPEMWRSWQSWAVNPQVLSNRIQQAAASMKRTHELLTGAHAYRQRIFERANTSWSEYIRGQTIIYNAQTNTFKELPNDMVQEFLQKQNLEAGFQKYKPMSLADLNEGIIPD